MTFRLEQLFSLNGRTALVTGGSSGIGLAMARALGLAGAKVVLAARRAKELAEAAESLRNEKIQADTVEADLDKSDAPERAVRSIMERGFSPNILINAAGINLRRPFQETSAEEFDRHLEIGRAHV